MHTLVFSVLTLTVLGLFFGPAAMARDSADPGEIDRRIQQLRPRPAPKPQPAVQAPTVEPRVEAEIAFVLTAVTIEGASVFEAGDLASLYAEFLARTVGPAELEEIAHRVTERYGEAGYFLSRAVVPPQDVQGGVLRLRVVEGYLAGVRFEGGPGQEDLLDAYRDRFTRERPARLSTVERGLLLINGLPGIAVGNVQVAELDDDGAYELRISVGYRALSGSANLDNRGTPEVGPAQAWASVALNSIFGLGEELRYSFATVPNSLEELIYGQVGYQQPLGTAGTVFGASIAGTAIDAGSDLAEQDTESRSTTAKIDLRHPLSLSRRQAINLRASFEVRSVTEDRFRVSTIDDRLRVVRLQADYALQDDLGGTNFLAVEFSRGLDILNASDAGDAALSRADGEGSFTKFRFDAIRLQQIWGPLSLRLAGQGQVALDPLLSSEEFLLGGSQFGRAYDFGEISGEDGVAGSAELRFARDRDAGFLTRYEVYGFFDGGALWNRNAARGERRQSLTSAGGGVRLDLTSNIQSSVEVAKPLTRPVESTGDNDLRFFFAIGAQF